MEAGGVRMEKFLGKGCGEESTVTAPEEDCSCRNHIKEGIPGTK